MFYAEVHRYDTRYGLDDMVGLLRFKTISERNQFVSYDRRHSKAVTRSEAVAIDKAAFARDAVWSEVDGFEEWACDLPIMDEPKPMVADPLTYKELKAAARQLTDTCRFECGGYINELAYMVEYLVNTLPIE